MFNISVLQEPDSLEAAVGMLHEDPALRVIAGGTDVLIRMHHGTEGWERLLSLRNVQGLDAIALRPDGTLAVGATAPFARIHMNPDVRACVPILAEAAVSMGGPQIRNMATIGGNICNGAVSGDSASTLFALDARLHLVSHEGERVIPIHEFYAGPGKVKLKPGEVLTTILIPRESYQGTGGHYIKFAMRKAMDIATLGVAVVCRAEGTRLQELRLALGVAAPVPIRCAEAEAFARGRELTPANLREIGRLAVTASNARTSWRASKDYREHLIEVLTERAVKEAAERAGGHLADE